MPPGLRGVSLRGVDTLAGLRFHPAMRWVLLVASLLASVFVGELVAVRVVDEVSLQRRQSAGGVIVPYEPGVEADLLTDEFRVRYRINRFGYRDRLERLEERTRGTRRIGLLGDSFAAGWGVEFEQTFGDRLERATGIEVVNAAKNGGCPLWFVPQARHLREHFSPDWLLVQIFDNDADDNAHSQGDFRLELGERFEELPPRLRPLDTLHRRLSHAFDSSVLRRRFRQLSRRVRGKRLHSTPYVRPGAKPDHLVLTREESIARHQVDLTPSRPLAAGFGFYDPAERAAWQQRLDWNEKLLDQLLEESGEANVPVAVLYIPIQRVFLREPENNPLAEGLREVVARHGALWLDAREVFGSEPRPWELYHPYDGHLNAAGHAAIAEALVRDLAPRVLAVHSPATG
jgi:lysophospholipase L1-like esterase